MRRARKMECAPASPMAVQLDEEGCQKGTSQSGEDLY